MSNPGPTHIAAAKRILRYLAGTRSLGITYQRGAMDPSLLSVGVETGPNQLSASADADHADLHTDLRHSLTAFSKSLPDEIDKTGNGCLSHAVLVVMMHSS